MVIPKTNCHGSKPQLFQNAPYEALTASPNRPASRIHVADQRKRIVAGLCRARPPARGGEIARADFGLVDPARCGACPFSIGSTFIRNNATIAGIKCVAPTGLGRLIIYGKGGYLLVTFALAGRKTTTS